MFLAIKMIECMIEPLKYEVQLAPLALQKTEEVRYVAHSEGSMTPVLKSVIVEGSRLILGVI